VVDAGCRLAPTPHAAHSARLDDRGRNAVPVQFSAADFANRLLIGVMERCGFLAIPWTMGAIESQLTASRRRGTTRPTAGIGLRIRRLGGSSTYERAEGLPTTRPGMAFSARERRVPRESLMASGCDDHKMITE
jgi:hypothetical protein